MTDKIQSKVEDGVGWLIFNNPEKRNAMSLEMAAAGAEVVASFAADDAVRVIVLRGEGGKAFVSGADISEFEKRRNSAEAAEEYARISRGMYEGVRALEKPTVAMIEGFCMGGGVALACGCDIRICSDNSVFAIPAARLGIGYNAASTRWVMEAVGPVNVKEMLFTARRYNAEEAKAIGLVSHVVPQPELMSYVTDYATNIAGNAPLSVRAAKLIAREVVKSPGEWNDELCDQLVKDCADSEDYKEGRTAFMEKRQPTFKGV